MYCGDEVLLSASPSSNEFSTKRSSNEKDGRLDGIELGFNDGKSLGISDDEKSIGVVTVGEEAGVGAGGGATGKDTHELLVAHSVGT